MNEVGHSYFTERGAFCLWGFRILLQQLSCLLLPYLAGIPKNEPNGGRVVIASADRHSLLATFLPLHQHSHKHFTEREYYSCICFPFPRTRVQKKPCSILVS